MDTDTDMHMGRTPCEDGNMLPPVKELPETRKEI